MTQEEILRLAQLGLRGADLNPYEMPRLAPPDYLSPEAEAQLARTPPPGPGPLPPMGARDYPPVGL